MKYKIICVLILSLLLLSTCSKYVKVKSDPNNSYYAKRWGKEKVLKDTRYYPFERSQDTMLIGYKTVYAISGSRSTSYMFDTIPFCGKTNKPVASRIYEVYYYKGQPRFTKEIGAFREGGFLRANRSIVDLDNWNKQVELGLQEKLPVLTPVPPKLTIGFEMDTTNYTADDIEYILKGATHKRNSSYYNIGIDSSFLYLRKDGVAFLSAGRDHISVKYPNAGMIFFWISDFSRDLSTINVYPNEDVKTMFNIIPDSLLNSKSCEFPFDTLTFRNSGKTYTPECYKEYINIKFKDGNYKTWSYLKCAEEKYNIINKYPWMHKFINDIEFLYFLPASNNVECTDPDFTLGNTCHPNSIKIKN